MKDLGEALLERLKTEAPRFLPGATEGDICVVLDELRGQKHSVTGKFQLISKGAVQRVFVKAFPSGGINNVLKHLDDPAGAFAREYDVLDKVYHSFEKRAVDHLLAVRPLAYFDDPPAIVMEQVDGTPLRSALFRAHRFSRERDVEYICGLSSRVGAWLSHFHRVPVETTGSRRATWDEVFNHFEEFLNLPEVSTRGRGWSDAVEQRYYRFRKSTPLPNLDCGVSHGDFAPRNVFIVGGDSVLAFDTLAVYRETIYWDLSYFATSVRTLALRTVFREGFLPCRTTNRIIEAFLSGYAAQTPIDRRAFEFFALYSLLDRWRTSLIHLQNSRSAFEKAVQKVRVFLLRQVIGSEIASLP